VFENKWDVMISFNFIILKPICMKHLSVLLFAVLATAFAQAQDRGSVSVNLYGGYNFSDKVEFGNSYGYVEEAFQYGGGIEYFYFQNNSVEVKYLRSDMNMPLYGPLGTQLNKGDDDGAINYILVGGTSYFGSASQTVLPYIGAGLGVGIVETPQSGNETTFAWDLKLGMKIKTASVVSVNLQAYLQSATAAVGNSYYYTYYGIVPVTDYVSVYQFGLGATLSFNFQ
jgi:outer membrane protein W